MCGMTSSLNLYMLNHLFNMPDMLEYLFIKPLCTDNLGNSADHKGSTKCNLHSLNLPITMTITLKTKIVYPLILGYMSANFS